ncbi:MAG: Ig-like domain-containing protein [Gemmatimonadales bacterium]|nr:Ig-like domain-containing protein [Gemmatimonadales bacterium]
MNLAVGGTGQFVADARDAAGRVVAGAVVDWSSSNPTVATISSSGIVTARAPGQATIAASADGVTASAALTVLSPLPDLSPLRVDGPATGSQGATVRVDIEFRNAGGAQVPSGWTGRIVLSGDQTITLGDLSLMSFQASSPTPGGGTQALSLQVPIPAAVQSGVYFFGLVLDATSVVGEADETNNALAGSNAITIAAPARLPDLAFVASGSDALVDGFGWYEWFSNSDSTLHVNDLSANSWKATLSLSNIGQADVTSPFTIRVYLSSDQTITSTDTPLFEITWAWGPVRAGVKNDVHQIGGALKPLACVAPPSGCGIVAGRYYLGAILDTGQSIPESNEQNNVWVAPWKVNVQP